MLSRTFRAIALVPTAANVVSCFSLKYKFSWIIRELSQIITTFVAIQPARMGWVGQDMVDSVLWKRIAHRRLRVGNEPRRGAGNGRFLNVIFDSSNFATLIPSEDIATKRSRRVYYTRMPLVFPLRRAVVWYTLFIIRDWRGLAELLISTERQCEGQMSGISKEVFPASFFMSSNVCQGKWTSMKEKKCFTIKYYV